MRRWWALRGRPAEDWSGRDGSPRIDALWGAIPWMECHRWIADRYYLMGDVGE